MMMKEKTDYINNAIALAARRAIDIAKKFCEQFEPDVFGNAKVRRAEYINAVYSAVRELDAVQKSLGDALRKSEKLKTALLSEAENAFLANENVNADNVCRTISQVEALENVCLAICEDCVAKYVCALETSLDGDTSENGMREIHVSALKKDFSDLVLRTEQYLKALTE